MKTILFTLFVTALGLRAQTPQSPVFPQVPTNAVRDTNRDEMLRQALLRGTPGAPPALTPAAGSRSAPRTIPIVPTTNNAAVPGFPAAAASPGTGLPLPGAPVPGAPVPAKPALPLAEQMVAIPPPPGATNAPPEEMVPPGMIDFRGVDLNQVLTLYAEFVNRTILRPANLAGAQIVLKTQTPLTRREAIQALDAILALNGIAMINVGEKFVKAVPVQQANQEGAPFDKQTAEQLPDMGQYVTHVVQLKYLKPTEVVPAIQPFAKMAAAILPIDASGILVLRDNTENVKRMLEMIERIDVVMPSEFVSEVVPIKYALASDIASALNSLSTGGGGTSVGAGGAGGAPRSTTATRGTSGGLNRPSTGGYPGMGAPGSPFGAQGTATPGAQPGGGSSFTDRLQNIIRRASVSGDIVVLGQTKIIADERSNSLLIYASKEDMKIIKDIIGKLDVVLAQVLIEAVILQVSLDDSKSLGVSYLQRQMQNGQWNLVGALNNKNLTSKDVYNLSGSLTNVGGLIPAGFSYLALGNDLDVAVSALASSTKARILQRPKIQTSHGVPASIFVGQNRPYPVSSYYGGGAYGGYASIQQLQIGVSLDVTPLINIDGLVVMDIHTKIDSFDGNVEIANVGQVPVTSSKDATAKVAVKDHDTIMLGGLIENSGSQNSSGVPYLKDVPLLGYLFRASNSIKNRNELIVLIRPTVLPTPEVASLAARAEKSRMPGLLEYESEIQREEAVRQRQSDKVLNSKQD